MKLFNLLFLATLSAASAPVFSAFPPGVMVLAKQGDNASVSTSEKSFHTKQFKVAIANSSDKVIDLSKFCLQAFSPDGKLFPLDTVGEKLTNASVQPRTQIDGEAIFASDDESVYTATLVKLTDSCR